MHLYEPRLYAISTDMTERASAARTRYLTTCRIRDEAAARSLPAYSSIDTHVDEYNDLNGGDVSTQSVDFLYDSEV
ncbi:hypothetical protein PybrP1_004403 [[Pythium] brassicae (nom. inval.)]|nr:hypothetical protein PybrP1_004403 [[Pythium] brassicae (nom. inval.)]